MLSFAVAAEEGLESLQEITVVPRRYLTIFNFNISIEPSNIELRIDLDFNGWKKFGEKRFKFDFRYE